MSISMSEKLKRRKLEALKRGVHRVSADETLPFSVQVVGVGAVGVGALIEILRRLEPGAPKMSALAVDIGDAALAPLAALAATISPARADVEIVSIRVPPHDALFASLRDYQNYLRLEYPGLLFAAPEPWLTAGIALPRPGDRVRRAVAKATYGVAYYADERPMALALRKFASAIEAARSQAVVAILFGLSDGAGSGMALDLARHFSNGLLGRRVLVAGVGIAPCAGETPTWNGAELFPVLNELDCLCDETKNAGIVRSCGELFRNPFTAGFLMLPEQPAWEATHDLAATRRRTEQEIAALLTQKGGVNIWETLRLLNWVAAPSTQHSAARTPWGAKWIHILGIADPAAVGPRLPEQIGLVPGYAPEYLEAHVADADETGSRRLSDSLQAAFSPDVPPQIVGGGRPDSLRFVLPCLAKTDLACFAEARAAYDTETQQDRLLDHSLLLEHGIVLSEPSTRLVGMAGASIGASQGWIAVPLADIRADAPARLPRQDAV